MRLVLTSDLHVDHHPEVISLVAERVRSLEPDVLVVAGDLSSSLDHLEQALAGLRAAAPRALFVPGNHDLWCLPDGPSSRERYQTLLPARARAAGFDALGREAIEIGGLRFAGVTGWFDYTLRNQALDAQLPLDAYRRGAWGRLRWTDKVRIRWPDDAGAALDDPAICDEQLALLQAQLRDGAGAPTVVITHHLPFAELVTSLQPTLACGQGPRGELPWDFLNGFMGSARLGAAIRATPGVRMVLSGHTHFRKSVLLDGADGPGTLRCEVSPLGYPREYRRAGLDLATRVRDRVSLVEVS